MNNEGNLHSYDGVELTQTKEFSIEQQRAYCMQKLDSAKSDLKFIKDNLAPFGGAFRYVK